MATIVVEMTAKELGIWRAQQKLIRQQSELQRGYAGVARKAGIAGRQGRKAAEDAATGWDTRVLQKFAGVLAGAAGGLSVAGALGAVMRSAAEARQEVLQLTDDLKGTYEGVKRLWQVSESAEAFEALRARFKLAMATEGIDRSAAQALVFTLKSFGELEALPEVAKTERYMRSDVAADYLARLRATTGWGKGIATPAQAFAGLGMGAFKSGFDVDVTADWFARTASTFSSMGATPWEVLGTGAALSTAYTTGEEHATAMKRMAQSMKLWRKEAMAEGTVEEMPQGFLDTFKTMLRVDPEAFEELVKNARLEPIAEALKKGSTFQRAEQLTEEIHQQFETGAFHQQKIAQTRPPTLTDFQQQRIAELQKELAKEPQARKELQTQTLFDWTAALDAARGGTGDWTAALDAARGGTGTGQTLWEWKENTRIWLGEYLTGGRTDAREATTRAATKAIIEGIREGYPEVYKEYIAPEILDVPYEEPTPGPDERKEAFVRKFGYPITGGRSEMMGYPGELTQRQFQILQNAMTAVLATKIEVPQVGTDGASLPPPASMPPGARLPSPVSTIHEAPAIIEAIPREPLPQPASPPGAQQPDAGAQIRANLEEYRQGLITKEQIYQGINVSAINPKAKPPEAPPPPKPIAVPPETAVPRGMIMTPPPSAAAQVIERNLEEFYAGQRSKWDLLAGVDGPYVPHPPQGQRQEAQPITVEVRTPELTRLGKALQHYGDQMNEAADKQLRAAEVQAGGAAALVATPPRPLNQVGLRRPGR